MYNGCRLLVSTEKRNYTATERALVAPVSGFYFIAGCGDGREGIQIHCRSFALN
jgi:hypothetical protein